MTAYTTNKDTTMTATLLAEKMAAAGVNTASARLFTQAAYWLNKSRSVDEAAPRFATMVRHNPELLVEMCRAYLNDRADDMRGPNERGGRNFGAAEAEPHAPSRSPQRDGAGPVAPADKATPIAPRSVSPGLSRRGLASIAAVQPAIAKSIFQTTVLPDGRSLDKVQWHELPKLAVEYRQHSRVLMALFRKVKPIDTFLTVDQIVHEADVILAVQEARLANDID